MSDLASASGVRSGNGHSCSQTLAWCKIHFAKSRELLRNDFDVLGCKLSNLKMGSKSVAAGLAGSAEQRQAAGSWGRANFTWGRDNFTWRADDYRHIGGRLTDYYRVSCCGTKVDTEQTCTPLSVSHKLTRSLSQPHARQRNLASTSSFTLFL